MLEIVRAPQDQPENTLLRRSIASAAAILALSGCSGSGEEQPHEPRAEASTSVAAPLECLPVTDKALTTVEAILKSTKEPDERSFYSDITEMAKDRGLTLYDYFPLFLDRNIDPFADVTNPNVPVSEYVDATSELLDKYGIALAFPHPHKSADNSYDMQRVSYDTLDESGARNLKTALANLSQNISIMPAEFIALTGLKQVNIVSISAADVGAFVHEQEPHSMYVDAVSPLFPGTFAHELTHLWDYASCNMDIYNDPEFEALNPQNMRYGKEYYQRPGAVIKNPYDSLEYTEANEMYPLSSNMLKLTEADKMQSSRYKKLQKQYDTAYGNVVVANNYGFSNIVEDKATIGERLFTGNYITTLYNDRQPILAKKTAYLLARLYEENPEIAEYFIEIGASTGK